MNFEIVFNFSIRIFMNVGAVAVWSYQLKRIILSPVNGTNLLFIVVFQIDMTTLWKHVPFFTSRLECKIKNLYNFQT